MTPLRHIGGDSVGKGNYWNFSTGERITMNADGVLPGSDETVYYKTNPFIILAVAPIMGLLFAAFLPFIGIAIILRVAVAKMFGGTAEGLAKVTTFNWNPSAAYLAGRKHKRNAKAGKAQKDESSAGPGSE